MNAPLNIALIGQHGAGKTTLAQALETEFNLVRITTGDLLKTQYYSDREIREALDNGKYVGDNIVTRLVGDELTKHPRVILDGFPRTLPQAN